MVSVSFPAAHPAAGFAICGLGAGGWVLMEAGPRFDSR